MQLLSGEWANAQVAARQDAIAFLSKPAYRRDWFGRKFKALHRHNRGPGAAVDYLNVGLMVGGKYRAIARFSPAPLRQAQDRRGETEWQLRPWGKNWQITQPI